MDDRRYRHSAAPNGMLSTNAGSSIAWRLRTGSSANGTYDSTGHVGTVVLTTSTSSAPTTNGGAATPTNAPPFSSPSSARPRYAAARIPAVTPHSNARTV